MPTSPGDDFFDKLKEATQALTDAMKSAGDSLRQWFRGSSNNTPPTPSSTPSNSPGNAPDAHWLESLKDAIAKGFEKVFKKRDQTGAAGTGSQKTDLSLLVGRLGKFLKDPGVGSGAAAGWSLAKMPMMMSMGAMLLPMIKGMLPDKSTLTGQLIRGPGLALLPKGLNLAAEGAESIGMDDTAKSLRSWSKWVSRFRVARSGYQHISNIAVGSFRALEKVGQGDLLGGVGETVKMGSKPIGAAVGLLSGNPIIGAAVGMAVDTIGEALLVPKKISDWAKKIDGFQHAEFSSGMAYVHAVQERRDIYYSRDRGDRLARSTQMLADTIEQNRQIIAPISDINTAYMNIIKANALGMQNHIDMAIYALLDAIMPEKTKQQMRDSLKPLDVGGEGVASSMAKYANEMWPKWYGRPGPWQDGM